MTAAELMKKLQQDKKFQEKKKKKDAASKKFADMLAQNAEPIIREINSLGFNITSVWDFVNSANTYEKAYPVLLKHLEKDYHPKIKAGIARALAIPDVSQLAWSIVLKEYKKTPTDESIEDPKLRGYKEGLAVALSVYIDESHLDDAEIILNDVTHGESRLYLVESLARLKNNARAKELIMKLKNKFADVRKVLKENFNL